ncbi:hypothetical protein OESDEN_03587 [Oesophagostomum dentatum]|uniref:Uncharacterized protein n=1 Tax=Oesophagostomum dentatum TaxID=61180 RepID=A0A0B1TKT9_OESDE|nr:hypothetical protein OESDEN_03587 [Oesophagostomum dentatum]
MAALMTQSGGKLLSRSSGHSDGEWWEKKASDEVTWDARSLHCHRHNGQESRGIMLEQVDVVVAADHHVVLPAEEHREDDQHQQHDDDQADDRHPPPQVPGRRQPQEVRTVRVQLRNRRRHANIA